VAKSSRRREKLAAPQSDYTDPQGNVLTLRGSLTAPSRRKVAQALSGSPLSREDAWQRAFELLFEFLAVRWVIEGLPLDRQRELLARLRMASARERTWVRDALREHCAAHFPDVQAP
jgi:hypothetical protein